MFALVIRFQPFSIKLKEKGLEETKNKHEQGIWSVR